MWPPNSSRCTRCYEQFNENPWARERSPVCESCGRERWAESAASQDWIVLAKGAVAPLDIRWVLEQTAKEFSDLLRLHWLDSYSLSHTAYWRELSGLLIALSGDELNDRATANALGFSFKTFHNRDKLGRELFVGLVETVRDFYTNRSTLSSGEGTLSTTAEERISAKLDLGFDRIERLVVGTHLAREGGAGIAEEHWQQEAEEIEAPMAQEHGHPDSTT